jgi:ATP-dependent Clp protease adaptor protein ClpS
LINLVGIAEPGLGRPRAAFGWYLHACGRPATAPYSRYRSSGWVGAAGSGDLAACLGTLRFTPAAVPFSVEISNACAMLQLTSISDSSAPPVAVSAPRMANNDENRSGGSGGPATSVIAKVKPKTKRPNLYRVLILNDDYTPMEFVVHVLEKFFQKDIEAATKIMLHVHHHGIGECGVFTYEIAETKVTQVMDFARKHQHPLQCVMEKK